MAGTIVGFDGRGWELVEAGCCLNSFCYAMKKFDHIPVVEILDLKTSRMSVVPGVEDGPLRTNVG